MADAISSNFLDLPRGGTIVNTSIGYIQIGIPPETIKDSMSLGLEVPNYFIFGEELFNREDGLNVAEAEFPAYWNFFVKGRQIHFICTKDQQKRILQVFQETLLGPTEVDLREEYPNDQGHLKPDLLKEGEFLRTFSSIDELTVFINFDENGLANIQDRVYIQHDQHTHQFIVLESNDEAKIASLMTFHPTAASLSKKQRSSSTHAFVTSNGIAECKKHDHSEEKERLYLQKCNIYIKKLEKERNLKETFRTTSFVSIAQRKYQGPNLRASDGKLFDPPFFGVTILGNSHGFDPSHQTSGFVLWVDRRGIMVDPPLYSKEILQQSGVSLRMIDCIIVSHCHADHDAGTMQRILDESQVTVITTPTIMDSFVRKYSALMGLRLSELRRLFVFKPAMCGDLMRINGAEIRFFYTIHTIPCIGFEIFYGGKSIYFSGDTCLIPSRIKEMHEKGVMSQGRMDFWLEQHFHHTLILHEAGVPPIHTPISELEKYPESVKQRMRLVHVSGSSLPKDSVLQIAEQGVENTIVIPVEPHKFSDAIRLLRVFESADMFREFTIMQAIEILAVSSIIKYSAGDLIVKAGDISAAFYVILGGVVSVELSEDRFYLIVGDYFGESALLEQEISDEDVMKAATVKASTECELIKLEKSSFLCLLRGNSNLVSFLVKLTKMRRDHSWQVINKNVVFSKMTNAQKSQLQGILEKVLVEVGSYLWKVGDKAEYAYVICSGSFVYVEDAQYSFQHHPFSEGALLAEVVALLKSQVVTSAVLCRKKGYVYRIPRDAFVHFLDHNPGLKLALLHTHFADSLHNESYKLMNALSKDDYNY